MPTARPAPVTTPRPAPAAAPAGTPPPRLVLTTSERAMLERELGQLRDRRDRELPARLREARTYVAADAAEEIAQIQDEQTVADARIGWIEELLATAAVIDDDHGNGLVSIGCLVELEYLRTAQRASYRLMGAGMRAQAQAVSARSPIGQALMGRRAGETVAATLPGGRVEELRILAVERPRYGVAHGAEPEPA
ncbi:MAG TPA: GreA/GreB family elongation factor [Baekduia sp.]|nr:GreA/GreB family elongation factor [Baekduia sp.]